MSGEGTESEPQPSATVPVTIKRTIDELGVRNWTQLSSTERRIIKVLADPVNWDKTETERMEVARVARGTWYTTIADPVFARLHRDLMRTTVNASVGALVQKSMEMGITTGRDGFNDRKMLLEMSGHYTPRQQIDHTTAGQPIVGVVGVEIGTL